MQKSERTRENGRRWNVDPFGSAVIKRERDTQIQIDRSIDAGPRWWWWWWLYTIVHHHSLNNLQQPSANYRDPRRLQSTATHCPTYQLYRLSSSKSITVIDSLAYYLDLLINSTSFVSYFFWNYYQIYRVTLMIFFSFVVADIRSFSFKFKNKFELKWCAKQFCSPLSWRSVIFDCVFLWIYFHWFFFSWEHSGHSGLLPADPAPRKFLHFIKHRILRTISH